MLTNPVLRPLLCPSVGWLLAMACTASGTSNAPARSSAPAPEAASFSTAGVHVPRPNGWKFAAADATSSDDAIIVLIGPSQKGGLAPVIEGRRPLDTATRRHSPTDILTTMTLEIAQLAAGFEITERAHPLQLGGVPAARTRVRLTESLLDGSSVERDATFYTLVNDDSLWFIRCIGSRGSSETDCETVLAGLSFDP